MSDAFFRKLFGDDEPTGLGSGWVSGVCAVFLGLLGLGGVLCLRYPAVLTLPDARAHYPLAAMRVLVQVVIAAAFALAALSATLRQRKALALTGGLLAAAAMGLGGGAAPMPDEVATKFGIGFDWFLLDLLVMTVAFVPLERFWPLHPGQKTFRPEWTTDAFYFVATHLPAQLLTLTMVWPAAQVTKWVALPRFQAAVTGQPYWLQLIEAIFVADLAQYFIHRMFHRVPFLWRFHSVHHSIKTLDWIAGSRSHFIDIVVTRGLIMIPLALCGFPQSVLAGYIVFVSFHATLCHTDFRPAIRWLEPYFVTIRYHHWHHSADPDAIDVNFAIHIPLIDKLFGTQRLPRGTWPTRYGVTDDSVPPGFFAQLVHPFSFKSKGAPA